MYRLPSPLGPGRTSRPILTGASWGELSKRAKRIPGREDPATVAAPAAWVWWIPGRGDPATVAAPAGAGRALGTPMAAGRALGAPTSTKWWLIQCFEKMVPYPMLRLPQVHVFSEWLSVLFTLFPFSAYLRLWLVLFFTKPKSSEPTRLRVLRPRIWARLVSIEKIEYTMLCWKIFGWLIIYYA